MNKTTEIIPEQGVPVIGYHSKWVDKDFNSKGVRECFWSGDMEWFCPVWNNDQDCYDTENEAPEYWMPFPDEP